MEWSSTYNGYPIANPSNAMRSEAGSDTKGGPEAEDGWADQDVDLNDVDVDNLPEGWRVKTHVSGKIFIKDANGNDRLRYDPPQNGANGHWHYYGPNGAPLDASGNPTTVGSPESHIYR